MKMTKVWFRRLRRNLEVLKFKRIREESQLPVTKPLHSNDKWKAEQTELLPQPWRERAAERGSQGLGESRAGRENPSGPRSRKPALWLVSWLGGDNSELGTPGGPSHKRPAQYSRIYSPSKIREKSSFGLPWEGGGKELFWNTPEQFFFFFFLIRPVFRGN